MSAFPQDSRQPTRLPTQPPRSGIGRWLVGFALVGMVSVASLPEDGAGSRFWQRDRPTPLSLPAPLAMRDGDPHLRALMRTISAAESNVSRPYHVLYGGQYVNHLQRHPDRCITIVAGPNVGNCTTAAGRYQFLTTTWQDVAQKYHPAPPRWYLWWEDYSFEPVFQDEVLYRWLADPDAWGSDLLALLRQDRVEEVLYLLSGTWTSLGYGTEDNANTPYLVEIYHAMLEEELQTAAP